MASPPTNAKPKKDGPAVNEDISSSQVRLIRSSGENVGVTDTQEAFQQAAAEGLDLVEISPNARPPVAKIMDYGKYKYEAQKKKSEARKKQSVIIV
ncbi:MAG TPA: translation initiation factor IF-3, partial [Rhodospirillales bacterium]|nr:translation initiation factor IF-3 [Rhodospirillales bacterium]